MIRQRGNIVAVRIMTMIVLSSGGAWWGMEWMCVLRGERGSKNSLEWISCSFFLIVIFTLYFRECNIIDGIVRIQFMKRFQFQFYK